MFSQKQNKKDHSKTQLDEKNLAFSRCFLPSWFYFFTACQVAFTLHNKR